MVPRSFIWLTISLSGLIIDKRVEKNISGCEG